MIKNEIQFFRWWTAELKTWFSAKFSPLATETNVDNKTSAISTAITNMRGGSSTISAIDGKIGNTTDQKENASLFGKIADVKHSVENLDTSDLAKRSDVKSGDDTTIGMLKNQTYGLNAIRTAIGEGAGRIPTDQFNALAKDSTVAKSSQISVLATQSSLNGLHNKVTSVEETLDGVSDVVDTIASDTTAILSSTDKIGSPATGSANDTLFKAIENIEFPDDIASEENATINKNEVIEHEKDMTSIIMSHIHDQRTGKPNCIKVASLWYHAIGVSESTIKWMSLDQFTSSSPAIIYTNANTITVGTQTYTDESCTVYYTGVQEVTSVYLAQRSDVKDGNDTAISVSKAIKVSTDKIGTPATGQAATLFGALAQVSPAQVEAGVTRIQQRLDVAESYTADVIPTATAEAKAQDHLRAVHGAVSGEQSTTNYKLYGVVRVKHAASDTDSNSELASLNRNLVYGGATKDKSWQSGGQVVTTKVPDTGYGFTEFWLKNGDSWIHYTSSLPSQQDNINTLHPALHTTTTDQQGNIVRTPTHIIVLTNPV